MEFKENKLSSEPILESVLEEVDAIRLESYNKLLKKLISLGASNAMDIANYFFGKNPDIKQLTENLLKEINIIK